MSKDKLIFVSVVRDFEMYDCLVKTNPNNGGADFVAFDNREDNKTITARYNSFLNNYDYSQEAWFVFCHEDFQLLEPLVDKLRYFDKSRIYGVIGKKDCELVGMEIHSDRDGGNMRFIGRKTNRPKEVDTLDCQCMIVHSSLVDKYRLRFDEKLSYDLYVEDFCIWANSRFNIPIMAFPLKAWHHSRGNVQKRYFEQEEYLSAKYGDVAKSYSTTCSSVFGSEDSVKQLLARKIRRKQREKILKIYRTSKGNLKIRIFGIQIFCGPKRHIASFKEYCGDGYEAAAFLTKRRV